MQMCVQIHRPMCMWVSWLFDTYRTLKAFKGTKKIGEWGPPDKFPGIPLSWCGCE